MKNNKKNIMPVDYIYANDTITKNKVNKKKSNKTKKTETTKK